MGILDNLKDGLQKLIRGQKTREMEDIDVFLEGVGALLIEILIDAEDLQGLTEFAPVFRKLETERLRQLLLIYLGLPVDDIGQLDRASEIRLERLCANVALELTEGFSLSPQRRAAHAQRLYRRLEEVATGEGV